MAKRPHTIAKRAREAAVKERRDRKRAKREEAAAERAAARTDAASPDALAAGEADETIAANDGSEPSR